MFHVVAREFAHLCRIGLLVGIVASNLALPGCAPATRVTMFQPAIQGRQRQLQLVSEQARWAPGKPEDRLVVEFPLPGADTGEPMYLLYLRWPNGATGPLAVDGSAAAPRGFLIQTRGQYAGLACVVGGSIEVLGRSLARGASRELSLNLMYEDGTCLAGRVRAVRDDYYVRCFEIDRHPADIQALSTRPAGE